MTRKNIRSGKENLIETLKKKPPAPGLPMTSAERPLLWFLRLTALLLLAAAFAVVMPHAWMNAVHAWLGLGELPELPMVGYLTRSMSALYALLGILCWQVARDVRRFLPILQTTVPLSLLFSVVMTAIDIAVALPIWWMLIEGPFLFGWTLALWILVRRVGRAD